MPAILTLYVIYSFPILSFRDRHCLCTATCTFLQLASSVFHSWRPNIMDHWGSLALPLSYKMFPSAWMACLHFVQYTQILSEPLTPNIWRPQHFRLAICWGDHPLFQNENGLPCSPELTLNAQRWGFLSSHHFSGIVSYSAMQLHRDNSPLWFHFS